MGTRGAIGFRYFQQDKVMYNHFDSYPSYLGVRMVKYAKRVARNIDKYKKLVEALKPINEDIPPSPEIIAKAKELGTLDLTVSEQSETDWYCVTRGAQGDLDLQLKLGVFADASKFLINSLFCEYAYIINLDNEIIEFYKGFNKVPDKYGRYAHIYDDGYYGVALVGVADIHNIPDNWEELFYPTEKEDC